MAFLAFAKVAFVQLSQFARRHEALCPVLDVDISKLSAVFAVNGLGFDDKADVGTATHLGSVATTLADEAVDGAQCYTA